MNNPLQTRLKQILDDHDFTDLSPATKQLLVTRFEYILRTEIQRCSYAEGLSSKQLCPCLLCTKDS